MFGAGDISQLWWGGVGEGGHRAGKVSGVFENFGTDECGKFKTGEEKGSGRFEEERGRGVLAMPRRRVEGFLIFRGGGGGDGGCCCCWKRAANSVANAVKLCWEGLWEAAGLLYRSFAYLQRTFVYAGTHTHTHEK